MNSTAWFILKLRLNLDFLHFLVVTEEIDLNMKFSVFHQEKAVDFSFCDFLFQCGCATRALKWLLTGS